MVEATLRDIRVYRDIHPDESHELTILVFLADEWQSIKKLEKEAGWASGRISNTYQNLFNEFVNSWKFVDPFRDPETHQRPNHVENMSRDASDLIRLLQSLDRSPRQSIYEEICESYENIMEGVTSLRIEHDLDKNETDKVTLVTKEDGINARFKADEISSGSKEILVLLTQIYASKQDTGLLAIEEPELHLHPGAEKKIFDIISETATLDGPQVITSTHSEVFVNFSDVSDIVTVKKDPYTQLKAISEPDWDSSQVLGVDHSNLLQSDAVVFVEGRSDKVILEQFASCIGTPLKNQGVELVVMNGDEFLSDADRVLKVLNQLRIPFMIVYDSDGDNPNEKEINKAQELGISPEAVHVLERYSR